MYLFISSVFLTCVLCWQRVLSAGIFFSCLVCNFFQNILVSCYHIFVFPRSWNSAANDNNLWKINYSLFFGLCHLSCNSIPVSGLQKSCELVQSSIDSSQLIQILGGKSPSTVNMQVAVVFLFLHTIQYNQTAQFHGYPLKLEWIAYYCRMCIMEICIK